MCGRFGLPVGDRDIAFELDVELSSAGYRPRYNIAPSQNVLIIRNEGGKRLAETFRWGLIPFWAKDDKIG